MSVDRGKHGSKIQLVTERTGLPLSVGSSGANTHDSQALIPLVQGIPPIRSRRGRRRRRPGKLHGDKGYDYDHLRQWLRSRGITPRIARKGTDSSQRLGRHRWTIERTMCLACRMPTPPSPLRTQGEPLPGLHQHRLHPHLLPTTLPSRRLLGSVGVGEMGAADGAAEEHGGCPVDQVCQEVLKLVFVVPAVEAHVGPQLVAARRQPRTVPVDAAGRRRREKAPRSMVWPVCSQVCVSALRSWSCPPSTPWIRVVMRRPTRGAFLN